MSALDDLLKANVSLAKPLSAGKAPKLCVVACDDARLSGQLASILGLSEGGTVLVRLPGAGGGLPDALVQRVIAKSVYVEGCQEVVLLSHTGCTLEGITDAQIRDRMGQWGVLPDALPCPVREAVGAEKSPRDGLRKLADRLRAAALLPRRLPIHVAHLDEETGRLAVVQRGDAQEASDGKKRNSLTASSWATRPAAATAVGVLADSLTRDVLRSAESATAAARAESGAALSPPPTAPILLGSPAPSPEGVGTGDRFTQSLLASTDSIVASTMATSSLGDSMSSRARAARGSKPTPPRPAAPKASTARPVRAEQPPPRVQVARFPAEPAAAPPPWVVAPEPPKAPPAQASARPAARAVPPSPPRRAGPTHNVPVSPQTEEAIERLCDFIGAEFRMLDRQRLLENVEVAFDQGRSAAELAQVVVEAIIELGDARYRVMNTLVHFKEGLSGMPPSQAIEWLRKIIR